MARPNKLKELEEEFGKPLEEVFIPALNEHKTVFAAAKALGIANSTLWLWMRDKDVKKGILWQIAKKNEPANVT